MAWFLPNRYFEEFPKAKTTKMTRNKRKTRKMRKTKEKAIQSEYPCFVAFWGNRNRPLDSSVTPNRPVFPE